jgi:hypothetical protein
VRLLVLFTRNSAAKYEDLIASDEIEIDKCPGNHDTGWKVLEEKGKHIQPFSQKHHFDL